MNDTLKGTTICLILAFSTIQAMAQTPKQTKTDSLHFTINLSELDKLTIQEHETFLKQAEEQQKEFQKFVGIRNDEYINYLKRLLKVNKVPLERISDKGDSLKINSNNVTGILRQKKK